MPKKSKTQPTAAELAILQVLWREGPSTVRQVQEQLEPERGTGYTTTLKLMQIMHEKGLLRRDDSSRSHVYAAAQSQTKTQKAILRRLIDQVFDGSAQQLVLQALSEKKASPEELKEIRQWLDQQERGR